ncbi:5'-3' exonuclease [Kytococcus aerolatus]|uniref:5'-3' exonuclease n=1 Tax=Kytococcus aerolatus TaxID=592308 RepID=A0A212T1Q3_9MICO|nr:5'-3' exonuclease [Kytococcus aerolatus]SNC59978.1 5'-3' exonuclease [Kytococcus aerolatus]
MKPSPVLLVDAASLYYRAFHGVPDRRRDPAAPPNNAVRGLLDMTASLLTARGASGLAMCWDEDWRPAFRVEALPSYKEHRLAEGEEKAEDTPPDLVPQVPVICELLAALGIARIGSPGHEADDVLGTLASSLAGQVPVEVVTGDRDLFQLVDDELDVRVVYTARGGVRDADAVDCSWLQQRYGVASGERYADLAVLRGDASDGLPGVRGIGEKTAAALLEEFGSLAGIQQAVTSGDPRIKGARRARLEEGAGYLAAAPRVVHVVRDAPLRLLGGAGPIGPVADPLGAVALPVEVADPDTLEALRQSHDLGGSVDRVLAALGLA